uniref:RING-CH-type domain-containing protein n=1 Tax=Alexandrium andersonii TaxID=327968 RepID=A0A7S2NER4_9DINO|mmetsp:Transcript_92667/g.207490  ORF Transcript_92667/g.207490 Transcript_92667/m.207490 type:complete len:296 (+) Transcript_92667:77-964(+)
MVNAADTAEICRICLDTATSDDELIAPCLCSGSMKYVHRGCLDRWRIEGFGPETFSRCGTCKANFRIEHDYKSALGQTVRYLAGQLGALVSVVGFLSLIFLAISVTGFLLRSALAGEVKLCTGTLLEHFALGAAGICLCAGYAKEESFHWVVDMASGLLGIVEDVYNGAAIVTVTVTDGVSGVIEVGFKWYLTMTFIAAAIMLTAAAITAAVMVLGARTLLCVLVEVSLEIWEEERGATATLNRARRPSREELVRQCRVVNLDSREPPVLHRRVAEALSRLLLTLTIAVLSFLYA